MYVLKVEVIQIKDFCVITDIHSHILPGVDDGSDNWNMTLEMILKSWDSGVRNIIATPHYLPLEFGIRPEQICALCREAEERSKQKLGIDMKIYPGQEIFFHLDIIKHLKEKKIQTMNNSRYILVEFDTDISWQDLRYAVQVMKHGGYKPILAHIERYNCLKKKDRVQELLAREVFLQINVGSISGSIFSSEINWCRKQIKQENIAFLASDMHNMTTRPPFEKNRLDWLHRRMDKEALNSLIHDNASQYLKIV